MKLNIASVSDIHLGHKRNHTKGIVNNLRSAFPDNEETAKLDIIFLAGDVFDDLLTLNFEELAEIDFWIHYLLKICKKHNIMLRVLEGTPSHDWKQSRRFEVLNAVSGIGANLKYVRELSIEHIEEYGITVLYVPDEWNDTTEKTLSQAKNLIRATGQRQVDVAVMHGQFEYQLPEYVRAQKHSSSEYLSLVKGPIFIGHVHGHSWYERIIAQGSFDRLSFGEEEAKGHVRGTYDTVTHSFDWRFVPNEGARIFKTIDCSGMDIPEILSLVDKVVEGIPEQSYMRIAAETSNPILTNMEVLIRTYSQFTWKKKAIDSEIQIGDSDQQYLEEESDYVPITITPDNVIDLVVERMRNSTRDTTISDYDAELVRKIGQEIINAL